MSPKKPAKIDLKKAATPLARYMKSVAVELTPDELEARSKEAGRVFEQMKKLEAEKKIFDEDINAKIKSKDSRLTQLLVSMKSGTEDREIKVSVVPDFEAKRAYTVREDNGEVLEDRALTAEERDPPVAGEEVAEGEKPAGKKRRKLTRAEKKADKSDEPEDAPDDEPSPDDGDDSNETDA